MADTLSLTDEQLAGLYYTTAPASYDYPTTTEVTRVVDFGGVEYRVVVSDDADRFESFQRRRYDSGLYTTVKHGTAEAERRDFKPAQFAPELRTDLGDS